MYSIKALTIKFQVSEKKLTDYFKSKNIKIDEGGLNNKQFKIALEFIEQQNDRILNALNNEASEFISKDGRVSIYREDAIAFLEKLPPNSVDLIVTDPAYSGMNNKLMLGKGRIVGKYSDKGKENGKWFDEFEDSEANYIRFLSECKRVLKTSTGHIYIMFDSFSLLSLGHIVRKYFEVKNLITWDKVNLGMGHYFRRRHEYIIFATNGNNRNIRDRNYPDVWRFKRIHNAKYPTQKPVELFQTMISASAKKDFIVCDPFVGSASSAIASLKNECYFIGCDISSKAMEISKTRISNYIDNKIDILQTKPAYIDENKFWEV